MRISCLAVLVLIASAVWAQSPMPAPAAPERHMGKRTTIVYRHEMGKWWQNSEIAKKLQLSDDQINQLDQVFYQHRLKLIDDGAAMEKEDLKLQTLLDADVPNEGQIGAQVDQVLAARGRLEREFTMMNLDLRKVLSLDQWHQLKAIRGERGAGDNVMFFRKVMPGKARTDAPMDLPLPPPPGPSPDDLF